MKFFQLLNIISQKLRIRDNRYLIAFSTYSYSDIRVKNSGEPGKAGLSKISKSISFDWTRTLSICMEWVSYKSQRELQLVCHSGEQLLECFLARLLLYVFSKKLMLICCKYFTWNFEIVPFWQVMDIYSLFGLRLLQLKTRNTVFSFL